MPNEFEDMPLIGFSRLREPPLATYACHRCGAIVVSDLAHDHWHDEMDGRSSDD